MALISIPTSIGGVSIPGLVTNGPLGLLYKNPFGRQDLQYPRDLQSATRGHVVNFAINEIDPLRYEEIDEKYITPLTKLLTEKYTNLSSAGASILPSSAAELVDSVKGKLTTENVKDVGGSLLSGGATLLGQLGSGEVTQKINLAFKNRTKKSTKSISLYMPDTVNFNYGASYGQTDLLTAFSSVPIIVKGVDLNPIGAVTQTLNNPLARLGLKGIGYALNPNQQVLFDGIDFRTYQLVFYFTPYSKQEADTVAEIIKMFKIHAAPRLLEGAGGGMFFIPPSTFTPTFRFRGQINKKISQVTESVITNINVDYAPQGFSAHTDGAPVQTTLTIDFRELELITSQKVEQGF
jgi:hypothetical protein